MSDRATHRGRPEPLIDRPGRITGTGRLIVLAFGLVGVSIGLTLMSPDDAQPFVLGLLAILAVIGVITLLASAIGLLRFSGRGTTDDLGKLFMGALGEGVIITSRDGGIIYANRAYADLIGATEASEARALERVMVGNPEAAEALYRITQELGEGRPATEEVRMPVPLAGGEAAGGAHWYRISVRPLPAVNKRKVMIAWTLTDISAERARQESAFQELQHAIDYLDHAPAGFFSAEPDGRSIHELHARRVAGHRPARFDTGAIRLADIVQGDGIALLMPRRPTTRCATAPPSSISTSCVANGQCCPFACSTACR